MKIGFVSNQLGYRGTEIALFDYAYYNEKILNNESLVMCWDCRINPNVLQKFQNVLRVIKFNSIEMLGNLYKEEKLNALYVIVSGERDHYAPLENSGVKLLVHCVFNMGSPFGHVYAGISPYVGNPYVLHMINPLPVHNDNLRQYLKIPTDNIVIGRHGGTDTFDIEYVKDTILKTLENRSDIYFIFMPKPNGFENINHERIIYLEIVVDNIEKKKFINTCDAYLHARSCGETFGLSIAEFSACNKPIITAGDRDGFHLSVLKDKCFKYYNSNDLYEILMKLDKKTIAENNWDMYSEEFSPEKIMKEFNRIFLDRI